MASLFPGQLRTAGGPGPTGSTGLHRRAAARRQRIARLSLNLAALLQSRHIFIQIIGALKWRVYEKARGPGRPRTCRFARSCDRAPSRWTCTGAPTRRRRARHDCSERGAASSAAPAVGSRVEWRPRASVGDARARPLEPTAERQEMLGLSTCSPPASHYGKIRNAWRGCSATATAARGKRGRHRFGSTEDTHDAQGNQALRTRR